MKNLSLLPEGFVYPVGYRPTSPRILDGGILEGFKPFERPFVVTCCNGLPGVDPNSPMAVARLRNGRCPNLSAIIRYLELGEPDEGMQATYSCEDTLATACDYSEAGFHETAIEIIRALPTPFQRTGEGLEALVESLTALTRYTEALEEVRILIASRAAPTEWALTLQRLKEVQLLLVLGQLDEAETSMNQRRREFADRFQYYGCRAASAWLHNDELLARSLVVKAGRVDPYHAYKILWNPVLAPLDVYIRDQLLTSDGEPLGHKQNEEMHKICNRTLGALLLGERDRAANLAEGLIRHRVTSWSTAEEMLLVLAGLGQFEELYEAATILAGKKHETNVLTRQLARAITEGTGEEFAILEQRCVEAGGDQKINALVLEAAQELAAGRSFTLPSSYESLLAEIGGGWREEDRDLFQVHCNGDRFTLTKMSEPRRRRSHEVRIQDLRNVFNVIETSDLASPEETANWIEEKLAGNVSYVPNNAFRAPSEIHLNGWSLVRALKPSSRTPLLREAWETACDDPNFYFKNGPATSFGAHTAYVARLLMMLELAH